MNTFSGSECIKWGWETFKKRPWFFIGVTVLVVIVSGICSAIGNAFGSQEPGQSIGTIVNFLLGTFVGLGLTAFYLKAHDMPDTVQSGTLWHPTSYLSYLGAKLLTGLVVVIGLILLIVPGVILGMMFLFSSYIVVDKHLGPIEAMTESKRITAGHKLNLFGFFLLVLLLNIVGAICLLVGLLVTIPVTGLAFVHAYRTLAGTVRTSSATA